MFQGRCTPAQLTLGRFVVTSSRRHPAPSRREVRDQSEAGLFVRGLGSVPPKVHKVPLRVHAADGVRLAMRFRIFSRADLVKLPWRRLFLPA